MDESSRIDRLERKLEELGERLENAGEKFGERMEEFAEEISDKVSEEIDNDSEGDRVTRYRRRRRNDSFFWGIVLIAIGTIWIGNNLDWFHWRIELFPSILILIGLYILVRSPRR